MRTTQLLSCLLVSLFWLSAASSAHAAFMANCGGANDIDTPTVTAIGCNVVETGLIADLNVALEIDDLAGNPYATDLQLTLTHVASGTTVSLYVGTAAFAPTSRMDAIFDDSAGGPPPASGDILGAVLPVGSLSAFNGLELSGAWVLQVLDISAFPNDGIDLIDWNFTGVVPEPTTALLLTSGLLGLTLISGRVKRS